jgi:hypothetical protein
LKQIEVVFCGNSVYFSGLAASLRQDSRLRIVEIDACLKEATNELKMLRPEVVVAEIVGHGAVEALCREYPGLSVIAVEAATDSMVIFTGRTTERAPVSELARLIITGVPANGGAAAGTDERQGTA